MTQHPLIIATGNAHKVEEFQILLDGLNFDVQSAKACGGMPEVDENGSTFAANAQLKAETLRAQVPAGAWVLADDSGLEVDALDGAPGIYSARYAGLDASDGDNVGKLLEALQGPRRPVPPEGSGRAPVGRRAAARAVRALGAPGDRTNWSRASSSSLEERSPLRHRKK